MSGGSGFGSFMQGLQGGIGFGQDVRRNRQREKLYDAAINEALDAKKSRKLSTKAADELAGDGQTTEMSDYELPDPYLYDFADTIRSKVKGLFSRQRALPVTDPQEVPGLEDIQVDPMRKTEGFNPDMSLMANDTPRLAGGGLIDDLMVAGEVAGRKAGRKALELGADAGRAVRAVPTLPEGAGIARRMGGSKVGTALGAGTLLAGALEGGATDTEDYYRRMPYLPHNAETPAGQFGQDLLARGLGVASDVAGSLPIVGKHIRANFNDVEEDAAKAEKPVTPPAKAEPSAPLGSEARTKAVSRSSGKIRALPDTVKEVEKAPNPLEGIDLSKMRAEDVPNFSTTDWTKFRNASVRALTLRGMPIGDAMEKVDQQVMGIQIRGMQMFANQALMRMESGDLEGAAPYVRAAFQYVPSTTDIKTTVHNGHIIAQGYDEETGKPEGPPFVINSERLSAVMKQFTQPGAFAEWAQDRREFKLKEQDTQSMMDYRANQSEIGGMRAEAAMVAAEDGAGGGAGGAKMSDVERPMVAFQAAGQDIADEFTEEPDAPKVIAAYMGMMYQMSLAAGRQVPAVQIIEAARRMASTPDGLAKMRQQLSGQQ